MSSCYGNKTLDNMYFNDTTWSLKESIQGSCLSYAVTLTSSGRTETLPALQFQNKTSSCAQLFETLQGREEGYFRLVVDPFH